MANSFKSKISNAIGTSKVTVYTVPGSTTSTVIGLSIANILASGTALVDVKLYKAVGASETFLIKGCPVVPGGAEVIVGGDQKVVLETGDSIKIQSSIAVSIDAVLSVLEIT